MALPVCLFVRLSPVCRMQCVLLQAVAGYRVSHWSGTDLFCYLDCLRRTRNGKRLSLKQ